MATLAEVYRGTIAPDRERGAFLGNVHSDARDDAFAEAEAHGGWFFYRLGSRRLEPFSQSVAVFVTHVVIHKGRSCFGWLVRNSLLACELGSSGNHCPSVREIALWVFFGEVGMPTLGDVPLLVWLGSRRRGFGDFDIAPVS
jgi:hypothetical protein